MQRRVYSYIRFSTPEQAAGHSLQRQMDYAQSYAEANGLMLDDSLTLRDEGLSAYHQKHISKGALGTFLRAVEDGKVPEGSVLILEGLDRLSRAAPYKSQAILSQIISAGITVITASDNKVYDQESLSNNPMDLIYSLIVMIRAHEESHVKSKRITSAFKNQIKQWVEHGHGPILKLGSDPCWITIKDNQPVLIPEMVSVITLVISKYKSGWGLVKIARHLNQEINHPKKDTSSNDKWNKNSIFRWLRNRALIGEKNIKLHEENYVIKNYYPPVLSESDFNELQHFIKNRGITKAQSKIPGLITGMRVTYCGYCNTTMVGQNFLLRKDSNGSLSQGNRRIHCQSLHKTKSCKNWTKTRTMSIVPIEHAILNYCTDQMDLHSILSHDDKSDEREAKAGAMKARIDELQRQINHMTDQFATMAAVPQAFIKRVNDYEDEYRDLMLRYDGIRSEIDYSADTNSDVMQRWQQITSNVGALDEDTRLMVRQLVKQTFKRIEVFLAGFNGQDDKHVDLVLTFHNDARRCLKIDRKTGEYSVRMDDRNNTRIDNRTDMAMA